MRWYDRIGKQPNTIELIAAGLWLIGALVAFSDAGFNGLALLVILFGLPLGMLWVLRFLVTSAVEGLQTVKTPRDTWPYLRAWAFTPLVGLIGIGLAMTDWDLVLRLHLSEPYLMRLVEYKMTHDNQVADRKPRFAGLFLVHSMENHEGVILLGTGRAYLDRNGLAYTGDTEPPFIGSRWEFTYLHNGWWRFDWDF